MRLTDIPSAAARSSSWASNSSGSEIDNFPKAKLPLSYRFLLGRKASDGPHLALQFHVKPAKRSNTQKKVESEPFPIELKSVRKHPNTHPLLEIPIRGGYSCQKISYDPFPTRLRFDFQTNLRRTPDPMGES